ncbi:hypothetical protein ACJ41O_007571 [Fusarium nematophilum]
MASRSLYSMSVFGTAPKIFSRYTESGITYVSIGVSAVVSLLAFLNVSSSSATVFNWFVNLTNCTGFISWICMCAIYLRFYKATFAQGIVDNLPYRSIFQPLRWNTSNFITSYFGIVLFIVFYLGHKFVADRDSPWVVLADEVDLHTDLREAVEKKGLS